MLKIDMYSDRSRKLAPAMCHIHAFMKHQATSWVGPTANSATRVDDAWMATQAIPAGHSTMRGHRSNGANESGITSAARIPMITTTIKMTIDGIGEALAELAKRYRLAVVSDAIVTPGTGLRAILDTHGLAHHFQAFAFSDEVGHSKPHASMFESAAEQLGVALDQIVHIGDRDHNDVAGPHAIGAKAVLFTGSRPDDREITKADAICERHADLPAVIDRLAAEAV